MIENAFRNNSLVQRVVVAVLFIPLLLWIFAVRGLPLFIFTLILSFVGQIELFGMIDKRISLLNRIVALLSGVILLVDARYCNSHMFPGIIISVLMLSFLLEIWSSADCQLEGIALTLFSAVYPAALLTFLLKIESVHLSFYNNYDTILFVFLVVTIWVFDSASYFAGLTFGKHRFFPRVSPKKTIEGFVGGITGAVISGAIFGYFAGLSLLPHFVAMAVLIALAGQAGDLSESVIKRAMKIKDSSHIIPGHGGLLDRFDSLIFAAPVVYTYLYIQSWLTVR